MSYQQLQLQQRQPASVLLGHVAPVLTLDNHAWMLASGSEDKTCRIWDLRTNRVHKALIGFNGPVSSTSFTPADDHTIFVSSTDKIYTFDLRMESRLLDAITRSTRIYDGAEDEINQIQVNHRASYLAACDDAGDVRILDLKSHRWMRQVERRHDNIVMSVQFVPKKDLQVISGGMDKLVVAWDFYKGRATQFFDADTPQESMSVAQSRQLFNPPFVHSVAAHPSGTRMAIGLGDGSIQFLHLPSDPPTAPLFIEQNADNSSKKKKKPSGSSGPKGDLWVRGGRLVEAHSSPIATLKYAGFNPNWLVAAANNGSIAIWDDQASRYETWQQHEGLVETQERRSGEPTAMAPPPTSRALQPVQEFSARGIFERLNCISTGKTSFSTERQLYVAGTHPKTGDAKLQGRIAVFSL